MMRCPVCASADLMQATRDLPYTDKAKSTVLRAVSCVFCVACGEGVLERAEARRISAVLLDFHQTVKARH